jgi:hypothetical protein
VAGYLRTDNVGRFFSPKVFLIVGGGAWVFIGVLRLLSTAGVQTTQERIGMAIGGALLAAGLFLPARLDRVIVSFIVIFALFVEFLNLSAAMMGSPVASANDHVLPIIIAGSALCVAISGGLGKR